MRKGKDPNPEPDLDRCLMDPDPEAKNMRILRIRIPNTGYSMEEPRRPMESRLC